MALDLKNGKFSKYNDEIFLLAKAGNTYRKIARMIIANHKLQDGENAVRIYVQDLVKFGKGEKVQPSESFDLPAKLQQVFKRKDVHSLEELSDSFDIGIGRIKEAIEKLIAEGFNYKIDNGNVIASRIIPKSEPTILSVQHMSQGFYKFGITGDNHLCSKYQRLEVLHALYDLFEAEGVQKVYNTGNWIDGEARFNKHDLLVHGMNRQIDYWIENYPQRKGVTTDFITGDDHEGWYIQREGINVGEVAEDKARKAGREDLKYIGHMEADIILPAPEGETLLRVIHPGGGSAYAVSYTSQKIVESYTPAEKPDILFHGHYHKAEFIPIRGVQVIQTGCTQDQTPFMRKKRLAAFIGGWIVEFAVDKNGAITRFKQEWIPFYDKAYYEKKWNYKW